MTFCERCGMEDAWCIHGKPAAEAVMTAEQFWNSLIDIVLESGHHTVGPLIISRYGGWCRTCTLRWESGDLIAYDEDEDAWICADCAGKQGR